MYIINKIIDMLYNVAGPSQNNITVPVENTERNSGIINTSNR